MRAAARASTSLDQPVGEAEDAVFGDFVAGDGPLPEEQVELSLRSQALMEALAALTDRERQVVVLALRARRLRAEDARRDRPPARDCTRERVRADRAATRSSGLACRCARWSPVGAFMQAVVHAAEVELEPGCDHAAARAGRVIRAGGRARG